MALNKQKGNMYAFVTHTWNAVKGKCPHDCEYCYMKEFPQGELKFDEKELKTDLGEGNFIFVGSSCDMFADAVPSQWILDTLIHCNRYQNNTYLFQTKNPKRFQEFQRLFPENTIIGTTIETNRENDLANCPSRAERVEFISIDYPVLKRKMITIEPIMDFDVPKLTEWIGAIRPEWVNIGADSKNHNLPEPSRFKIDLLITALEKITKVKRKDNLARINE